MDKSSIAEKVKKLLALAASSNENEASNAKTMAEKLIQKFDLKEEDYVIVEAAPIYTDDDLLFETKDFQEWKANLALVIGNKYDCLVIQEINETGNDRRFKYFVYGDDPDVIHTKALFDFVIKSAQKLIDDQTDGRGELYVSSFAEGLAQGVRLNIETQDFQMEGIVLEKKPIQSSNSKEGLMKVESDALIKKEPPIKERTLLNNNQDKQLDIMAYARGQKAGGSICIGKVNKDFYLKRVWELDEYDAPDLEEDASFLNNLKGLFRR
jgi:hypothetical protein